MDLKSGSTRCRVEEFRTGDPMMGDSRYRVVVVDDHPIVLRGLVGVISGESDLTLCGQAADATTALAIVETERPDMVIVDLSLGSIAQGMVLLERLRALDPNLRILVSSMHDENVYAERALRAGAQGYVGKHEPPEVLLRAIRRVRAGEVAVSPAVAQQFVKRAMHPDPLDKIPRLSVREFEVFSMIGDGKGTREIAAALRISTKTVETHRDRIKQKLGITGGTELTVRAVRARLERGE